MSAHRVHVHTSRQPIRWGDMDALGHVNNTVYFRYMEQARIEWLYAHREGGSHAGGTGPVIVAPVRCAVSTICDAERSTCWWSYPLSLILIFCCAMWASST